MLWLFFVVICAGVLLTKHSSTRFKIMLPFQHKSNNIPYILLNVNLAFTLSFSPFLTCLCLLFLSFCFREAVKEAMEPGLASITVYVSQDCTGIKDDAAVDSTGNWARRPSRLLFYSSVVLLL